jgi:hypothetical protein
LAYDSGKPFSLKVGGLVGGEGGGEEEGEDKDRTYTGAHMATPMKGACRAGEHPAQGRAQADAQIVGAMWALRTSCQ